MSTIIFDNVFGNSVRITRMADGQLVMEIKGPDSNPVIKYNGFELSAKIKAEGTPDIPIHNHGGGGPGHDLLMVTSQAQNGTISVAWGSAMGAGGGAGGVGAGGGAASAHGGAVGGCGNSGAYDGRGVCGGNSNQYGGACGGTPRMPDQPVFIPPQGITHVVASEGTTTTIIELEPLPSTPLDDPKVKP